MQLTFETAVAAIVFASVFYFIISEKIHRTVAVLVGSMLLIMLNVIDQAEAFAAVDFNTIFLLVGMMIIVGIAKRSGMFQYLAIAAAKITRGRPLFLLAALCAVTAVVSAFLDNVTTVLLIAPVSLALTDALGLHPVPFLMAEALASNIGGTATLIGDPPNIMIGSAAGLGFNAFLGNLAPDVILIFLVFAGSILFAFRRQLYILPELRESLLELDGSKALTDPGLALRSLMVIAGVILAFFLHGVLRYEAATIALAGAGVLLLISRQPPEEILAEVEWSVILFFMGLFIIVHAVVKVGLITAGADMLLTLTKGDVALTAILILWVSAFASAFIDNIPYVATMIPLIGELGTRMPVEPLWWALALGACLGGNGTLTGASANIIVSGIARRHGFPIRYSQFMRVGMPLMVQSILLSSVYLYFRYLR